MNDKTTEQTLPIPAPDDHNQLAFSIYDETAPGDSVIERSNP
jgi:hypothetical protein